MTDTHTSFQELRLLLVFIRHADSNGNIDFANTPVSEELSEIFPNGNDLDSVLYDLNSDGIIGYEEIGEDGFEPIIMASISDMTHLHAAGLATIIADSYEGLERRISEMLTFDPAALSKNFEATEKKLKEVASTITGNDLLKPIEKPLSEIRKHFESAKVVSDQYEEIYKNIVRPIQEEGKSGIRATVAWAIVGILSSTVITLIISNWDKIASLWKQ